jgi:N-acetylmuramoyl-L-alanine amidase
MARRIDFIVLHCTASQPTETVERIQQYWREKLGWKTPGYHRIIRADGSIAELLDYEKISNGVRGYNAHAIHISYIGGIDRKGKPKDTRTALQLASMAKLVEELKAKYPNAIVKGHRDFPVVKDMDNIPPHTASPKVAKACPSFNVAAWLKEVGLD